MTSLMLMMLLAIVLLAGSLFHQVSITREWRRTSMDWETVANARDDSREMLRRQYQAHLRICAGTTAPSDWGIMPVDPAEVVPMLRYEKDDAQAHAEQCYTDTAKALTDLLDL